MTTIGRLDPFFTNLISDIMVLERQPLTQLQSTRDTLSVRNGAYSDVKTKLSDFQSAVKALISTSTSYALTTGRKTSVSDVATGLTVLTASASSSAVPGSYAVHVDTLAAEHRIRSKRMTYSDQALGLTAGTILLGGAENRSAVLSSGIANTVTGFDKTEALETGQAELGSGNYYVEVDHDTANNVWKFRLVDQEGRSVSIKQHGSNPSSFTSAWQTIPTGAAFDTGRGLTINFGASSDSFLEGSRATGDAASVVYTAKGYQVAVDANASLSSIASDINSGTYADGMKVVATVVDNMLVLSAGTTGSAYKLDVRDLGAGTVLSQLEFIGGAVDADDKDASDGFTHTLQAASNASFSVNGVAISRSRNTGLTDVITGLTLNLAADAATRDATLTVSADWGAGRSAIDDFVAKFNDVQNYLYQKTAVEKDTTGGVTTYLRGALADDTIFGELRSDLFSLYMSTYAAGGAYTNLREIGLTIDDNLQATVIDSAQLEAALSSNPEAVKSLLDSVMAAFDTKLSRFTGTTAETGYLDNATTFINNEISEIDEDISNMNVRLAEREQVLVDQYAQMQAQLMMLTYSQQMWSGIYGSVNRYM